MNLSAAHEGDGGHVKRLSLGGAPPLGGQPGMWHSHELKEP